MDRADSLLETAYRLGIKHLPIQVPTTKLDEFISNLQTRIDRFQNGSEGRAESLKRPAMGCGKSFSFEEGFTGTKAADIFEDILKMPIEAETSATDLCDQNGEAASKKAEEVFGGFFAEQAAKESNNPSGAQGRRRLHWL